MNETTVRTSASMVRRALGAFSLVALGALAVGAGAVGGCKSACSALRDDCAACKDAAQKAACQVIADSGDSGRCQQALDARAYEPAVNPACGTSSSNSAGPGGW